MRRILTLCPALVPALVLALGAAPLAANGTDPNLPLTARGNEPGWALSLTPAGATLSTEAGETLTWPLPAGTGDGIGTLYALADGVSLHLSPATCRDTMTGMPFPVAATLRRAGDIFQGCAGDPADLLAGDWRLAELVGTDLPAEVEVTLSLAEGRVTGLSGCNRYGGSYRLTGEGLALGPLAGTRMACGAAQSAVEAAYLAALGRVSRFDLAEDGALLLIAGDVLLARFAR